MMDPTRKKVILNEINFWKQNNMLPEHYCDYLIALYSEGGKPGTNYRIKDRKKVNGEALIGILLLGIMSLFFINNLSYRIFFPFANGNFGYFCHHFYFYQHYIIVRKKRDRCLFISPEHFYSCCTPFSLAKTSSHKVWAVYLSSFIFMVLLGFFSVYGGKFLFSLLLV